MDIVKKQDASSALIPGTYVFHGGVTGEEIVKALMTGPASTGFTLTIPEGYKRTDIAAAVEQATEGLITADQFLEASSNASVYAADYSFLESAGSNSLEGFSLPEDLHGDDGRRCDDGRPHDARPVQNRDSLA